MKIKNCATSCFTDTRLSRVYYTARITSAPDTTTQALINQRIAYLNNFPLELTKETFAVKNGK